jgi:hypothetical protein
MANRAIEREYDDAVEAGELIVNAANRYWVWRGGRAFWRDCFKS